MILIISLSHTQRKRISDSAEVKKKEISADLNFARKLTSTIVVDSDRY